MTQTPLWLSEADVAAAIDLPAAIGALKRVLSAEAEGQAVNMAKTHLMVGPNDVLQAIGGAVAPARICGTKTWVNVGGKSQTLLILYSLDDGSLRAVIEATALGQVRTAAMSGVGTDCLAADDADALAIVGTGKQALPQIAAVAAVRPLKRIHVYSRTAASRDAFAAKVRAAFPGIDVLAAESLRDAIRPARIVTLCTNATQPFLTGDLPAPGTHINAVGAIVPARVEFAGDIFPRADVIAVDTVAGVAELSREFMDYFGAGRDSWDRVRPISEIVRADNGRPADADLTLFKPLGVGIADIAVAIEVLHNAPSRGLGRALPARHRVDPPLFPRPQAG